MTSTLREITMDDNSMIPYAPYHTPFRASSATIVRAARTDARFLAHLVATRENVTHYRLKNRISPENGAAAYHVSNLQGPKPVASRASRSA
jgi:hypothetical protein